VLDSIITGQCSVSPLAQHNWCRTTVLCDATATKADPMPKKVGYRMVDGAPAVA
jgi:hypothetical protein